MHRHRRASLIVAVSLLAFVVGLRWWLDWVGPLPGDRLAASRLLLGPQGDLIGQLAKFYEAVGSPIAAIATVVVATWTIYRRDGPRVAAGVLLAAAVVLVTAALKALWGPTPLVAAIAPKAAANYPSGHTAYVTSVLGYIAVVGRQHRQAELVVVCLLLVAGMGPARVADRSHLVSDVLGGYLLGAAWLILVILWARLGRER
jgi:membrane-associated phospholipid phosphatase